MAKYNKNFGKLDEENNLEYAPTPLIIDGVNVWTNIPEKYIEQGYYPVSREKRPENEGYYYGSYYELDNDTIVQKWEEHNVPEGQVVE